MQCNYYYSCWGSIGKRGGKQEISLEAGCDQLRAAHEIIHALGRYHEQSRPDRDSYVTINSDNISKYVVGITWGKLKHSMVDLLKKPRNEACKSRIGYKSVTHSGFCFIYHTDSKFFE